jgi:membrane-associated phospholipid phosphatase
LAELRWLQEQRTSEIQARIDFWDALPAFKPWTEMQLDLIRTQGVNPPRAHRGLALVHVAIYDAIIAAWYWKYTYHRPRPDQLDRSLEPSVQPPQTIIRQCGLDPNFTSVRATPRDPSYTSGNSTCGGAVGEILAFFFPRDAESLRAEAEGGGISRLYDGTHWSFDIEAGLEIGRRMSLSFIERARRDGAHPAR